MVPTATQASPGVGETQGRQLSPGATISAAGAQAAGGDGRAKGPGNGGTFLRKTTALKKENGEAYAPTDFFVGAKLSISGRTFHVVTCDKATRNFFTGEHPNHHVGRNLDWPADPEAARASKEAGGTKPLRAPPSWRSRTKAS